MDREQTLALARALKELGEELELSSEEAEAYTPEVDGLDFYLPRVPKGFYTGCFKELRKLTMPKFRMRR